MTKNESIQNDSDQKLNSSNAGGSQLYVDVQWERAGMV